MPSVLYIREDKMRNLADLKSECAKNNVIVVRSGKREAKADYEKALAKYFWKRDHDDEQMPPQLHPMLARNLKDLTDAERDFMWSSARWVVQEKVDGCRLLMFLGEMGNHFTSRRLSDRTYRYAENTAQVPHLSSLVVPVLNGTVLDGEVISPKASIDTGKTVTLNGLQATVALLALNPADSARVQREQNCQLIFKVFDVLYWKGQDNMRQPYEERMNRVADAIVEIKALYPDAKIEFVPVVRQDKKAYYEKIVTGGGEGVMMKDLQAPYEPSSSRTKAMYKVKRFEEFDGFVTNFAPGEIGAGWEKLVGGLEISAYDETSRAIHAIAWVTNMTFEDRCEATVCPKCGVSMLVDWVNDNGKRVVRQVRCQEHGEQPPALNTKWFSRIYQIRGQEITARVLRLKHAIIVSQRLDKPAEECTIPLSAWRAKFESKGDETGIKL